MATIMAQHSMICTLVTSSAVQLMVLPSWSQRSNAQHGLHPYDKQCSAAHGLTIMVNIMAQRSNEQHQLIHSVETLGDLAAHEHHVGGVQHIHHMAEVVVRVLVVVAAHSRNEGHDLALLYLEEVQDAAA